MSNEPFAIKLPQFEGPFALLLFFIERDELDIHDIQITKITNDFLEYINTMKTLDIEIASEFILVAATLMRIKARMLLPRKELDEEGNEIDPREDLIKRLLEYKKYKTVVADLQDMESERMLKEQRGNITKEMAKNAMDTTAADELHNLDLYKLLKVFQKVMQRFEEDQNRPQHTIEQYSYTIDGQKKYVLNFVITHKKASFEQLLEKAKDKIQLVYSFLAILEMLQQQVLEISIGIGYNNFWLSVNQAHG